jgi:hypothetical protein
MDNRCAFNAQYQGRRRANLETQEEEDKQDREFHRRRRADPAIREEENERYWKRNTVRLTSIHNPVSEYREFPPQPHSDIVGQVEKIGCPTWGVVGPEPLRITSCSSVVRWRDRGVESDDAMSAKIGGKVEGNVALVGQELVVGAGAEELWVWFHRDGGGGAGGVDYLFVDVGGAGHGTQGIDEGWCGEWARVLDIQNI